MFGPHSGSHALTEAATALTLFVATLLVGLVITVPAYLRLLRRLELDHPDQYEALGRPTLWMGSPPRSLALQRFIYRGSRSSEISRPVAQLCRFLGAFTPMFLAALLAELAWFVIASLAAI